MTTTEPIHDDQKYCALVSGGRVCDLPREELAHDPEYHEYHPFMGAGDYMDIVFDGPPSHESGRFVEVESPSGHSVRFGEWVEDGAYWRLRFPSERYIRDQAIREERAQVEALVKALRKIIADAVEGGEHVQCVCDKDEFCLSAQFEGIDLLATAALTTYEEHSR